jgi:iron complex outermembrane receptor protein
MATRGLFFCVSVGAVAIASSPLSAQTTHATAAADAGAGQAGGVADIIVTAERHSATIQKTPIAITAVTGDEVRKRQLNSIGDILAQTPAVVVQNSTKGEAVFIRGIGSTGDAQEGGDPAISLNIDGVYQQQAVVPLASSFDINRVEVLRGPQGTLYGRNSNAGSVNVITNDPRLGENSGYFNLQLGDYRAVRSEAAANVALGADAAARIALVANRHDGYYSNDGDSADGYALRGKLKVQPVEPLTITLTGLWATEDGNPQSTVPAPLDKDHPYNTTYPAYDGTNGNPFFPPLAAGPSVVPHGVQNVKFGMVYGQLDYDLGFATFTLLPAHTWTHQYQDTVLLPLGAAAQDVTENANSLEARLASAPSSPVTWVVGLYGFKADDDPVAFPRQTVDFVHRPIAFPESVAMHYGSRTYAAFGQVTVPITGKLRVTGGARYTHDQKRADFRTFSSSATSVDGASYTRRYGRGTYKAGVEYDLAPRSLFYAQVSTGFKAGGINPNGSEYDPEKITAYEAGLKNRFFDNKVQLNLDAYLYNYHGYQARVNAPDCSDATGFSQQTINAASLKNYGGEAELTVWATHHDRLSATAAYLHSRGRFTYDNGICSAGVITHDYEDLVEAPPNSPKWSGTIGYEHRFDLPGGMSLTARGDMRWSASYDTSIDDSIYDHQGGFTRTDASLTWSSADDRLSVRAFIKNIENKTQKLFTLAPPVPFAALEISAPQTYGVALSAKF